jgi:hypothetical protein
MHCTPDVVLVVVVGYPLSENGDQVLLTFIRSWLAVLNLILLPCITLPCLALPTLPHFHLNRQLSTPVFNVPLSVSVLATLSDTNAGTAPFAPSTKFSRRWCVAVIYLFFRSQWCLKITHVEVFHSGSSNGKQSDKAYNSW